MKNNKRLFIMWGRNGRQISVITVLLITCLIYFTFHNNYAAEQAPMEVIELTEDQLKILRAFKPPDVEKRAPEEASFLQEKKDTQETSSPSKTRNDALQKHLRVACETFNISKPLTAFMLSHMHYDNKRKVVYCFIPKVACTSWKRIWMKLTGIVPPTKNLSEISRYTIHTSVPSLASLTKEKISEILAKYKKFMFVRHPFDRVLSAFKDKLESEDKQSSYNFHKEIGVRIQKKYRPPGKNYTGDDVKFPEFIRFISEPGHGTFEQRNEHWLTVHDICNPCGVKYDFVGKYENLKEDAHYVLDWIGASDLIKDFPVSDRPFHALRYDPRYFGLLQHNDRVSFFQKYIMDFSAFNYTFL